MLVPPQGRAGAEEIGQGASDISVSEGDLSGETEGARGASGDLHIAAVFRSPDPFFRCQTSEFRAAAHPLVKEGEGPAAFLGGVAEKNKLTPRASAGLEDHRSSLGGPKSPELFFAVDAPGLRTGDPVRPPELLRDHFVPAVSHGFGGGEGETEFLGEGRRELQSFAVVAGHAAEAEAPPS